MNFIIKQAESGNYEIHWEDKTKHTLCPCCDLPFKTSRNAALVAIAIQQEDPMLPAMRSPKEPSN